MTSQVTFTTGGQNRATPQSREVVTAGRTAMAMAVSAPWRPILTAPEEVETVFSILPRRKLRPREVRWQEREGEAHPLTLTSVCSRRPGVLSSSAHGQRV